MKRTARIIGTDSGNRIEIKVTFTTSKHSYLIREEINTVVARAANMIFSDLPQLPFHNFDAINSQVKM